MATKLKAFQVYAKCIREVGITIRAESLADAVAKSDELEDKDFVTVKEEYLDGSTKVTGVFELEP